MTTMPAIRVAGLTHRFRRTTALDGVDLQVPEGTICALLGPNGAGKTTLLSILAGLLRPTAGEVEVLGRARRGLPLDVRARIAYVAEGRGLPGWMRLREAEAYMAPLYPTWDHALASHLRSRFTLDPESKIRTLSRGERMKAALLCALAARPRLLLLDEPFAGMDVLVRDELVRGLLESAATEGWSVVISSHEVTELEPLAERVAILHRGRLHLVGDTAGLAERFRRVEVILPGDVELAETLELSAWGPVERAGHRLSWIVDTGDSGAEERIRDALPDGSSIEMGSVGLKELFVATVQRGHTVGEPPEAGGGRFAGAEGGGPDADGDSAI